MVGYTVHTDN